VYWGWRWVAAWRRRECGSNLNTPAHHDNWVDTEPHASLRLTQRRKVAGFMEYVWTGPVSNGCMMSSCREANGIVRPHTPIRKRFSIISKVAITYDMLHVALRELVFSRAHSHSLVHVRVAQRIWKQRLTKSRRIASLRTAASYHDLSAVSTCAALCGDAGARIFASTCAKVATYAKNWSQKIQVLLSER